MTRRSVGAVALRAHLTRSTVARFFEESSSHRRRGGLAKNCANFKNCAIRLHSASEAREPAIAIVSSSPWLIDSAVRVGGQLAFRLQELCLVNRANRELLCAGSVCASVSCRIAFAATY